MSCTQHWRIPKLLEAIGAKRRTNNKKTNSPGDNYQDSVGVPLSKEADNDAATQEGDDEADQGPEDTQAPVKFILPAVHKVGTF